MGLSLACVADDVGDERARYEDPWLQVVVLDVGADAVGGMAVVDAVGGSCMFVAGAGAVVTVSAVQAFAALSKVGAAGAAAETVLEELARNSGIWDGEAVDKMVSECFAKYPPLRRSKNQRNKEMRFAD